MIKSKNLNQSNISRELKKFYTEDQNDRKKINIKNIEKFDWKSLKQKDNQRLKRVYEIYRRKLIKTPKDMFYTAVIFQHGGSSRWYKRALELSKKSWKLGDRDGKWLYPRAEDRYFLSIGKPQIWGTQRIKDKDGIWKFQEPFNEKAKSGKERKEFGVDLEKIRLKLKKLNNA